MSKLLTIIGFTFKNKVKTRSFMVTTIIFVLVVTAGINALAFFNSNDKKAVKVNHVAVVQNQQGIVEGLQAYYSKLPYADVAVEPFTSSGDQAKDTAALKEELSSKKIAGYLTVAPSEGTAFPSFTYTSGTSNNSASVLRSLQTALQAVKTDMIVKDALTADQKEVLMSPIAITPTEIDLTNGTGKTKSGGQQAIDFITVYVLILLFFMTITTTGNMIAAEVTAEKSSRIMEILITSVKPLQQMFGKVIGMFLVGLSQIAVFAIAVGVNLSLPHIQQMIQDYHIDLSQIDKGLFIYGLIFYVLGYFLYSVLLAAIGSMVSRTEDLGQAIMPITLLSLASLYITMFSIATPNTLLVKVASFVPFTSSTAMILRMGKGEIHTWEVWVSIGILLVSILAFGWLSAKIYRTGVLMYGKRPTWKELFKAMKAYKI